MRHDARRRAAAVLVVLALPPGASIAGAPRPLPPFEASRVEFARQGAMQRLRAPECRAVLDEFRDAQGRPLSSRLADLGLAPDEYLAMIPFLDGRERPGCADGTSELRTAIGIPRVFVCRPFLRTVNRERLAAEVYVIHEMLHTLGLGENPPESAYIAHRVRVRCAATLGDAHRDRSIFDPPVQRLEVDRAALALGAAARSSSGLATGSALKLSRTTSYDAVVRGSLGVSTPEAISTPTDQPVGESPARAEGAPVPRGPPRAGEGKSPRGGQPPRPRDFRRHRSPSRPLTPLRVAMNVSPRSSACMMSPLLFLSSR
ncbi:MAG TPA: hypothetical protein VGB87_13935 [Vicinamibacteria bacterium]